MALPLIKFMQIIKITEKLEFIKIDFGERQQAFLSAIGGNLRDPRTNVLSIDHANSSSFLGGFFSLNFDVFSYTRITLFIVAYLMRIPARFGQ